MQEPQFAGDASSRASWYLARGEKRYGPMADRELLQLAQQGGLKTDDLLWRTGFDTWKTVQAVCGLQHVHQGEPANAEFLKDEVADISVPKDATKRNWKAKLYDELKAFLTIFAYLWLVFFVFLVHEWIVLADNHIGFRFYGMAALNALVLSKIMLIAEDLGFADRFHAKPLVVPIAYKSMLFSVLLVGAYILEELVIGWFHDKSVTESFPQLGGGGLLGPLSVTALLCIALVPFFAFRELARLVGQAEFRLIMFGPDRAKRNVALPRQSNA
jgi:hypothetical protein